MASLGFGIDLALKRRDAGSAAPASAIASLQILPANGLQAVDGADAADANGWVAKVVLPDDGVSTFDPTKIVLTVSDPGFGASGDATTVVRAIRGTAILRKQYPNQAQRLNSASGGVRTVHFALDDDVYQGSTLVSGQAQVGYYGSAVAGAIGGMSNGSTRAYPKPLFAWVNMHYERATGGNYAVEGVAFHRHAMNGRQVACVQYQARDAQAVANLSAVVSASVPQLSAIQTKGQVAEVYAASVSLANLTQADLCRVNAKVYPWLGDSTAVLDLLADGVSVSGDATTINPQTPLRFLNDRTGGYGGACAIVKPGGTATGSGKVAASYGGLGATLADAYPTIAAALTALQSYNQANKGHADPAGGTIYLGEDSAGAGATHAAGSTSGSAAGKCWVEIVKDPAATGVVKAQLAGANVAQASMLRWGCPFEINAGNFNGGSGNTGNTWVAFRGNAINAVASTSAPFNYGFAHSYFENVTMTGGASMPLPFFGFGGAARVQVRCVGLLFEDMPALLANRYAIQPFTLIGCRFANGFFDDGNWSANWDSCDGGVICNTQFLKTQASCALASGALPGGYARGFALVQNVIERTNIPGPRRAGLVPPLDGQRRSVHRVERQNARRPPPERQRAAPVVSIRLVSEQRMIVRILRPPDQSRQIVLPIEHRIDPQPIRRSRHHRCHHRPRKIDGPESRIETLDEAGFLHRALPRQPVGALAPVARDATPTQSKPVSADRPCSRKRAPTSA